MLCSFFSCVFFFYSTSFFFLLVRILVDWDTETCVGNGDSECELELTPGIVIWNVNWYKKLSTSSLLYLFFIFFVLLTFFFLLGSCFAGLGTKMFLRMVGWRAENGGSKLLKGTVRMEGHRVTNGRNRYEGHGTCRRMSSMRGMGRKECKNFLFEV